MPRQSPQLNSRNHRCAGFSVVELLAVVTMLAIVTAFGILGVSRARASVRLSGAARQYAAYIEKARVFSIKRHADTADQRATIAIKDNKTSYDVTMDLDGDGGADTRTIPLPSGITFQTVETVAFDWRGRTWRTANGVTESNAQVSIRLLSGDDAVSVDVTGSGDVTIDSQVFDDAVPNVTLNVGDLTAGAAAATPDAGGTPAAGASATPVASPSLNVIPSPSPILGGGGLPTPTPGSSPSPSPSPTATPSPSPTATPRSTPSPTPSLVCTITTDPVAVVMGSDSTTTVKVSHNANTTISISGNSSKPSDLQVTPGGNQTLGAGSYTLFTLKSKRNLGTYSVTFTASCGSKVVPVVVGL